KFHKQRGFYRTVVIALCLIKSQTPVQAHRLGQYRKRVKKHVFVSNVASVFYNSERQRPSCSRATVPGAHIQPFHFAVCVIKPPQSYTAGALPVQKRKIKSSVWQPVFFVKIPHFVPISLQVKVFGKDRIGLN